jgi:hypothetical protein
LAETVADQTSDIEFEFQDPLSGGRTFLDAIAEAARDASGGGGIFAFASVRGIAMLLDDPVVRPLTEDGKLDLFVGVDAITNPGALQSLVKREKKRSGLTARVVANDLPALFHPKICWFAHEDRLDLLVGSGNLTPGGLTSNVEAFTALHLEGASALSAEAKIAAWIERWQPFFLSADDPRSIERAEKNSGAERSLRKSMPAEPELPEEAAAPLAESSVLVAEISKNAPKRSQLDVGIEQFSGFFGGEIGKEKRILVQHVRANGGLDQLEQPRALFPTKSHNYRFEVSAGKGIEYPAEGRPIGLFARMSDAIFRYCLLWPGDPGHAEADAFLTERAGAFVRKMRRETATPAELLLAWPESPLFAAAEQPS